MEWPCNLVAFYDPVLSGMMSMTQSTYNNKQLWLYNLMPKTIGLHTIANYHQKNLQQWVLLDCTDWRKWATYFRLSWVMISLRPSSSEPVIFYFILHWWWKDKFCPCLHYMSRCLLSFFFPVFMLILWLLNKPFSCVEHSFFTADLLNKKKFVYAG